ncbi:hypothetical protein DYB26_011605 [Aphanomyces astaci]|uniref:Uncharacterized protein n=1 Tax=Aphanomyces astaci TaxID=112090 RepID=A0A418E2W7_APHAT|nr:hypothetical protein DYB26_011605 [Aphanomyces astaci]
MVASLLYYAYFKLSVITPTLRSSHSNRAASLCPGRLVQSMAASVVSAMTCAWMALTSMACTTHDKLTWPVADTLG